MVVAVNRSTVALMGNGHKDAPASETKTKGMTAKADGVANMALHLLPAEVAITKAAVRTMVAAVWRVTAVGK